MTFVDISVENLFNIKKLLLFDYREFNGNIPKNFETHNFWEIVYVCQGTICEITDKEKHILSEGDLLFHHPNKPHSTVKVNDEEVKVCFISFICNSKPMELFKNYRTSVTKTTLPIINSLIYEAKNTFKIVHKTGITKLAQRNGALVGGVQLYKIYLEELLIKLLREQYSKPSSKIFVNKQEYVENLLNDICEYLTDNIYGTVTLNSLCQKFNYGKSFISAKFKEQYGESIISYFNKLKINEACILIKEGKYSISQIAGILNFSNQYYFSKVFKKITGKTPGEYQAQLLSDNRQTDFDAK